MKLRYRSAPVPAAVVPADDGFVLELHEPAYGVARGQFAVLYDDDVVVGAGPSRPLRSPEQLGSAAMYVLASTPSDVLDYALSAFFVASGAGLAYMLIRMGGTFARLSSFIKGSERDLLPVIVKAGGTVDRVNDQLDKLDTRDGQRRRDGGQRGHGRPRGLDGDHDAREEGEWPCRCRIAWLLGVPGSS